MGDIPSGERVLTITEREVRALPQGSEGREWEGMCQTRERGEN